MKQKFPRTGPQKKVLIGLSGVSKPGREAFAKAVNTGVDAEIDRLCAEDNHLPPLWNDLAWALEDFAHEKFGGSVNQRLLKRSRIERIEALCRQIGNGGTFTATAPATH